MDAKTPKLDYDALITLAGGFGRFQGFLLAWNITTLLMVASQMGYMIFAKIHPTFQCPTETDYNTYSNVTNTSSLNTTTCDVLPNRYFYGYAAEWRAKSVSDLRILNDILTVQMVGMLVAPFAIGYISDRFGRRKTGFATYSMLVATGIVGGFCTTPITVMINRFFAGFFMIGFSSVQFIIMSEFMPNKWRTTLEIGSWPAGYTLLALLAMAFPHWQQLMWAIHIPVPIAITLFMFLPESPKWLLQQGRCSEAENVVHRIARMNRVKDMKPLTQALFTSEAQMLPKSKKSGNFFYLFRNLKTSLMTLTLYYCWINAAFIYFALSFNIGSLRGNPAVNTVIMMVSRAVICAMIPVVDSQIKRAGRQHIYSFGLLLVLIGLSVLLGVKTSTNHSVLQQKEAVVQWTALSCVAFSQIMWSMAMLLSAESFPTELRNASYGSCVAVARIGGILGPYVIDLELQGLVALPYVIFVGSTLLNVVLMVVFVPETKGKQLPDL